MKRMKPESIEERHRRKKREARRGVLFLGAILLPVAAVLLLACFLPDVPVAAKWICAVSAAVCILLFLPALWALKERYQEIEGGESDAAAQY